MTETGLILKLFEAAYMRRWNDKLRPMEFYELDKQAHKMMSAYIFASFEADPPGVFVEILEAGLFEFLRRIVLTDIKPPVFRVIQKDKEKMRELDRYVVARIGGLLDLFGDDTRERFLAYFSEDEHRLSRRILSAAHTYASIWEFDIIRKFNPNSYDNDEIERDLRSEYERYHDIHGVAAVEGEERYRRFLQLCGELRYQSRWSHLHRIPKTSVLGHSLFVAWMAYFFSRSGAYGKKRIYNDFVGALFHDLPEALTRDIISPIKRGVEGLIDLIKDYEDDQMEKIIFPLMPRQAAEEIRTILSSEFDNRIFKDGGYQVLQNKDIDAGNGKDENDPYDGEMIKACDDTAAYIEAASAVSNGCVSREFENAMSFISDKYSKRGSINGIDFVAVFDKLRGDIL